MPLAQWWIDEGHYGGLMREAIGWWCASSEAGTKYALIWCWRDKKDYKGEKKMHKKYVYLIKKGIMFGFLTFFCYLCTELRPC